MGNQTDFEDGEQIDFRGQPAIILHGDKYREWVLSRITARIFAFVGGGGIALGLLLASLGKFLIDGQIDRLRVELDSSIDRKADRAVRLAVTQSREIVGEIENAVDTVFENPEAKDRLIISIARQFEERYEHTMSIRALKLFTDSAFDDHTIDLTQRRLQLLQQYASFDRTGGRSLFEAITWRPRPPNGRGAECFDPNSDEASSDADQAILFNECIAPIYVGEEPEPIVQAILSRINLRENEPNLDWDGVIPVLFDRIASEDHVTDQDFDIETYGGFASRLPNGRATRAAVEWLADNTEARYVISIARGLARGGQEESRQLFQSWLNLDENDIRRSIAWIAFAEFNVDTLQIAERRELASTIVSATSIGIPNIDNSEFVAQLYHALISGETSIVAELCPADEEDRSTIRGTACYYSEIPGFRRVAASQFEDELEFADWIFDRIEQAELRVGSEQEAIRSANTGTAPLEAVLRAPSEHSFNGPATTDWRSVLSESFKTSILATSPIEVTDQSAFLLLGWTRVIERDTALASNANARDRARRNYADEVVKDLLNILDEGAQLAGFSDRPRSGIEFLLQHSSEELAARLSRVLVRESLLSISNNQNMYEVVVQRILDANDPIGFTNAMNAGLRDTSGIGRPGRADFLAGLAAAIAPVESGNQVLVGRRDWESIEETLNGVRRLVEQQEVETFLQIAGLDLARLILALSVNEDGLDSDFVVGAARANFHLTLDNLGRRHDMHPRLRQQVEVLRENHGPLLRWWPNFLNTTTVECEDRLISVAELEYWCNIELSAGSRFELQLVGSALRHYLILGNDNNVVGGEVCRTDPCKVIVDSGGREGNFFIHFFLDTASDDSLSVSIEKIDLFYLLSDHEEGRNNAPILLAGRHHFEDQTDTRNSGIWITLPSVDDPTQITISTHDLSRSAFGRVDTRLSVMQQRDNIRITSDDDGGGEGLASRLTFVAQPSEVYELLVENIGSRGSFILEIAE